MNFRNIKSSVANDRKFVNYLYQQGKEIQKDEYQALLYLANTLKLKS